MNRVEIFALLLQNTSKFCNCRYLIFSYIFNDIFNRAENNSSPNISDDYIYLPDNLILEFRNMGTYFQSKFIGGIFPGCWVCSVLIPRSTKEGNVFSLFVHHWGGVPQSGPRIGVPLSLSTDRTRAGVPRPLRQDTSRTGYAASCGHAGGLFCFICV